MAIIWIIFAIVAVWVIVGTVMPSESRLISTDAPPTKPRPDDDE